MDLSSAAARGTHRVGVATLDLADPRDSARLLPVDIWYPAQETSEGSGPADHPFGCEHRATRDAEPAAGPYPLVVFSHGNSGMRRQSTFLTTQLASHGMVVAAPDHTGNTFAEMLEIRDEEERQRVHFAARRNRPGDLSAVIDRVLAGDPAWPTVDASRIASLGHSFGGWTALKLPGSDPRVRAVCGLAPASEPFVGRKAFEPGELPLQGDRPVLLIAGIEDVLVDVGSSVAPLFERMAEPCALVGLEHTDHFHFCDGIPLLHGMHEKSVRPKATRRTLPYAETLPQERVHRILRGIVTAFFQAAFRESANACDAFSQSDLAAFDAAVVQLDIGSARARGAGTEEAKR